MKGLLLTISIYIYTVYHYISCAFECNATDIQVYAFVSPAVY